MLFAVTALVTAAAYTTLSQVQTPGPSGPLVQLADDLRTAISRSLLDSQQKARLESDSAVLESARDARAQGHPVDRPRVTAAVRDIRALAVKGGFSPEDQQALLGDVQALRKQQ